jgi:hypothetical protein
MVTLIRWIGCSTIEERKRGFMKLIKFKLISITILVTVLAAKSAVVQAQSCASTQGYNQNPIDYCSNINPSDPCCVDMIIQHNSELIDGSRLYTSGPGTGYPIHPECWNHPGPNPPAHTFINSNFCQSRVRRMANAPTVEVISPAMNWNIFASSTSSQIINTIPVNYKLATEVDQLWTVYPQQNPMTIGNVSTYISDTQPPSLLYNTYYTVAGSTNWAATGSSPSTGSQGYYSKALKLVDVTPAGSMQYIGAIPIAWGSPAQGASGNSPNARIQAAGYSTALDIAAPIQCTNIIPQLGSLPIVFQSRIVMVFNSLVGMTNCSSGTPASGLDPGNQGICTGTYRRLDPYMNVPASMFNNVTNTQTNYQIVTPQSYVCHGNDGNDYNVFGISIN